MTGRSFNNMPVAAGLILMPALASAQTEAGKPDYLIVFSAMALGLLVVALVLLTITRAQKLRYETIRTLVERGQPVPDRLLGAHYPQYPPREKLTIEEHAGYSLGWGVLLSFLGLGVGLANYLSSGEIRSAAWGLIFLFLGLGQLTNSAIIRYQMRRQANDGGR